MMRSTTVEQRTNRPALDVLEQALKNVGPIMEVRPRRVGGATYQVPMEVPGDRRLALAMRWLISAARARTGKSFTRKNCPQNFWMLQAIRVLLYENAKKLIRWPKPTALSRTTGCSLNCQAARCVLEAWSLR